MKKQCERCGKTFKKSITCSKKNWETRVKFCSKSCCLPKVPWNKGKNWSEEFKEKLSLKLQGKTLNTGRTHFSKGSIPWNKGIKMTLEQTKNMHVPKPNAKGINHSNWKGGVTTEHEKIRKSSEYKEWRTKVFQRDNYTCTICKIKGGWHKDTKIKISLVADHIKPFALFPNLRFEISNGRTLCKKCDDMYGFKWNRHLSHEENLARYSL